MVNMVKLIYLFAIYMVSTVTCTEDPCSTRNILDNPKRAVDYQLTKFDVNGCDRFITEGWYKILKKGNIPTECPPVLRCGSTHPVWLNGTLPTVRGERRNLVACQRGFIDCCELEFSIQVLNCGDFNVYELRAPPACPSQYCTVGAPAPCPQGMASDTGFEPCQELNISFNVKPEVEPFIPTMNASDPNNQLAFKCKIPISSEFQGYFFDVDWYIDKKKVYTISRIQYGLLDSEGVLHQKYWDLDKKATLGFQVQCAIRARENNRSPPTPYSTSDNFYAGVVVENTYFIVQSKDTVVLKFTSSVPVACEHWDDIVNCDITIELFSFNDQFDNSPAHCNNSLTRFKTSGCSTIFNGRKWKEYHHFSLTTLTDQSKRSSYTCSVNLIATSAIDTLWNKYVLPEVKVHVMSEKRPTGMCISLNDPHITTFDGRSHTTHERGEFVLYRHKKKPIEVHTVHTWGVRKYASNCAIAVRAATDVFVVYGCGFSPQKWIARRLNCDNEHQYLEIYERKGKYEVILPTGTRVEIIFRDSWLNIFIHISPSEWEQTEGLCGTYNGKTSDDFRDRQGNIVDATSTDKNKKPIAEFVKHWWVPQSQSIFIAKSRKEKLNNEALYCSCYKVPKGLEHDPNWKSRADCEWKEHLPLCQPLNWRENKCQIYGRTKREIEDDFEFDVPVNVVDFEQGKTEFKWENGWTEEKAVNACTSHFKKSKLFAVCNKLINVDDSNDLETCVADIKISGTDTFLSASLDGLKSSCLNEIRVNTTFWKPKPKVIPETTTVQTERSTKFISTTNKPSTVKETDFSNIDVLEKIVEEVFDNDCPSDCSNSGECIQGICECYEGFVGEDCSVNARKPPELFGASEESLCDVSKRPCSFISFFGRGFYDSPTVKCRVTEAMFEDQVIKPGVLNVTTDGLLVSFSELKCPVDELIQQGNRSTFFPILDAILVSVSFNEKEYSTYSPVVMYDSRCTKCHLDDGKVKCAEKEDICIVQNVCYHKDSPECRKESEKDNAKSSTTGMKLGYIGLFLGSISIIMTSTIIRLKRM